MVGVASRIPRPGPVHASLTGVEFFLGCPAGTFARRAPHDGQQTLNWGSLWLRYGRVQIARYLNVLLCTVPVFLQSRPAL